MSGIARLLHEHWLCDAAAGHVGNCVAWSDCVHSRERDTMLRMQQSCHLEGIKRLMILAIAPQCIIVLHPSLACLL